MNIQPEQTYVARGNGTIPYFTYYVHSIYQQGGWLMAEVSQNSLSGGSVCRFHWQLDILKSNVLAPLTPDTLVKYTTLQDMCWSGLTHNMALDLWNKGYRK